MTNKSYLVGRKFYLEFNPPNQMVDDENKTMNFMHPYYFGRVYSITNKEKTIGYVTKIEPPVHKEFRFISAEDIPIKIINEIINKNNGSVLEIMCNEPLERKIKLHIDKKTFNLN